MMSRHSWMAGLTATCLLAVGPPLVPSAWAAGSVAHRAQLGSGIKLINSGYLTVGSDTTYPPMESIVNGSAVGADVDLGNALAKAMGLKGAKFVTNDFNSIIPALTIRHRFDVIMSSMNDDPARRQQVIFVDYMRASEAILVRSSTSIRGNSYAAVCGHSIAVESGTTEYQGIVAQSKKCKITIKTFTHDTDAYQAFVSRHADAYSGDYPIVVNYVKKSGGSFRLAGKSFAAGEDYGIALRKDETKLQSALKTALKKIQANGQYKRILDKWGVGGASL